MIKKFAVVLAALALMLGGAVGTASAGPVKAQATINGCLAGRVCLYDWINNNYASGFWQRPISGSSDSVLNSSDGGVSGCMNLNDMQWHDLQDGLVYDAASSMIINHYNPSAYHIAFYDWINCNSSAYNVDYFVPANGTVIEVNLAALSSDCTGPYCWLNWANRFSSIRVFAP